MADFNEDDLYDMSDEDLEKAFKDAKSELNDQDDSELDDSNDDIEDTEQVLDTSDEDEDDTSDDEIDLDSDEEDLDEDDSEQPDADSDHDTSDEEEGDEESDEDEEETDEEDPAEDSDEDETETDEDDKEPEAETQKAQNLKFKANGQEYDFSEQEIKDQFPRIFGQAMDYTKKMQAIKPYRKTIDAIEQAELKHEDISLMIDVLKGDKDAITEVLKRTGVDALDLDSEEGKYVAKDYGRDESALDLEDVLNDINKDEAYATTSNIIGKQWDEKSWNEMSGNPKLIKQLHVDVQSGMFDTISPIMNKMKVFDGGTKSDLEYYKDAAKSYFTTKGAEDNAKAQQEETSRLAQVEADKIKKETGRLEKIRSDEAKRKATKKASSKRKAAAPTRTKSAPSKVIDYLDEDDSNFDEWYKKLQSDL